MSKRFVTVSIELLHDKKLTPNKKFILAEIESLDSLEKGCIASNKHFSELLCISTQAVSKSLHELEKDGYILIDNSQTKRNFGRIITINYSKSAINYSKSAINYSGESKENKTINKTMKIISDFRKSFKEEIKISDETLLDFIRYRKEIKKEIKTATPLIAFTKALFECVKAGYSKDEVINLLKEREWQTLKLDWVKKILNKNEDNIAWSNHGTDYDDSKEWK